MTAAIDCGRMPSARARVETVQSPRSLNENHRYLGRRQITPSRVRVAGA